MLSVKKQFNQVHQMKFTNQQFAIMSNVLYQTDKKSSAERRIIHCL